MTGAFVTGTDTCVGKTFVTCALARRARELGQRVFAFKPIETGCEGLGEDQRALCAAAGGWQADDLAGRYSFKLAAAPFVAAEAEGASVDLAAIADSYRRGAAGADLRLVEGAGGWRVPITASAGMADLARMLGLPVLVVARAGLGTINHSLLTAEAIERDGLSIAALVLSALPSDDPAFVESNAAQIRRSWSGRVFVFRDSADEILSALRST